MPGWEAPAPKPEPPRPPVGLQNLLLGLGTALVAIAVIVFTAVNWDELGATLQGLVLVAVTALAAGAASQAARRSMPATAEALGVVAVLLAIADVHAFRVGLATGADPSVFWAGGLVLVSAGAWALGRATGIRSPLVTAAVVAQLPLLFVLEAFGVAITAWQLALVAQAVVVLAVSDRSVLAPRWARRAGGAWALGLAALATTTMVLDSAIGSVWSGLLDDPYDLHLSGNAIGLVAAALLAVYVAWLRVERPVERTSAVVAATALGLGAVWFGAVDRWSVGTAVAALTLAAAVVVFIGRRLPDPWGEGPTLIGGLVAALGSLPFLGALATMLVAASHVSPHAWALDGSIEAAGLRDGDAGSIGSVAIGLYLLGIGTLIASFDRGRTRVGAACSIAAMAMVALVASPLVAPLSISVVVAVALAAVVVAAVVAVLAGALRPEFLVASLFVVAASAWATPWSLATPTLTFVTLGTGIVAAGAIAAVARRDGDEVVAAAGSVWVAGALPLLIGLVASDAGTSAPMAWAVASLVAAIGSVVGALLLDPEGVAGPTDRAMARAVEVTSLFAYVVAITTVALVGDPDAASIALAAGVLGFGLHAVRPHRRMAAVVAAGEALVLAWLQLAQADVSTAEAYTLPLALLLLVVGLASQRVARRNGIEQRSWVTYGPALLVGLVPTVWLSFVEPGLVRPLVGLVAGAVVLVGGVVGSKRALVDIGAATVVVLGLHQIAPVVGSMPNWATIGTVGLLLLAVGATFEQRRRDLKTALAHYSALR